MSRRRRCAGLTFVGLLLAISTARAEPYLAVENGLKCVACHVNPTGGGLRNAAGTLFAQHALAANPLPELLSGWTGKLAEVLRIGGDLRASSSWTQVPTLPTQHASGTDQARLYAELAFFDERVGAVLDEQVLPGRPQRQEAYLRLATPGLRWTLKAGQFYLPFGWRLQDGSAFVRQVSGIGMTTPDKGVEFGLERDDWSAQFAYTNGPGNAGTGGGHQSTAQVVWLQPWGRLGVAVAFTSSSAGGRQVTGLFGGTKTGPLSWLGEVDLVGDDGFPEGRRTLLAALGELNWRIAPGHNLKLTGEFFDPDRHVAEDQKVRRSLVYEYTPFAFVQLRAGLRDYLGIPQNHVDNRQLTFVELHAMF